MVEDAVELDADAFEGVILEGEEGDFKVTRFEESAEVPDEDISLILFTSGAFTADSNALGCAILVCVIVGCDVADTIFESEKVEVCAMAETEEELGTSVEEVVMTGAAVEEEVETVAEATEEVDDEAETLLVEVGDRAGEGALTAGAPEELGEDVAEEAEAEGGKDARGAGGDDFLEGSVVIGVVIIAGLLLLIA
jgi:hypothetical protein